MNTPKKKFLKVTFLLIFSILLFVALAYISEYFLLPILPKSWQTNLVWLGSAILGTIVILSGLAQFTGYSLKDIFSSTESLPQSHQNQDSQSILNIGTHGKINKIGDILQGNSTKIVVGSADMIDSRQTGGKAANVENLIRDIQSALYDDNSRLPYVLTLSLDLCEQTGLSEEYGKWLKMELSGYKNYKYYRDFRDGFDDEEQFEAWMDKWAKHRLIEPFVKVGYTSAEDGRLVVDTLPLRIFLALPVAEIARQIQAATDSGSQEFHLPLRDLGQENFTAVQKFVTDLSPGLKVPRDQLAFYTVSALEKVLNGVREIVLSLLSAARRQITE